VSFSQVPFAGVASDKWPKGWLPGQGSGVSQTTSPALTVPFDPTLQLDG
jgi:hypothetical protein